MTYLEQANSERQKAEWSLQGLGRRENYVMGTEFLLRMMKLFWAWIVVFVIQHYECM